MPGERGVYRLMPPGAPVASVMPLPALAAMGGRR
jgi:hypothetical protein